MAGWIGFSLSQILIGFIGEMNRPDIMAQIPIPNFFIAGAAKAGTTSLYHYLKQLLEVVIQRCRSSLGCTGDEKIRNGYLCHDVWSVHLANKTNKDLG